MKKGLTKNEREVLFGLVKYPTLNDRRLSEKTKVKLSTITAIRRRLHSEGYFNTVKVPAVNRLGYELTVIGYGRFNPSASKDLRNRFAETMKKENGGLYYFLTSPDFFFHISAARDYTSFRRWAEALEYKFADTKLFGSSSRTSVILPFETTMQVKHFHYSRALGMPFGLEEEIDLEASFRKVNLRKLTKKERTVLCGLVEYPELTDIALSEKIDASRQVISSMKKKFETSGLIQTTRIVDLRKLGYEIYAFVHVRINPKTPLRLRTEGIRKTALAVPNFIHFSGNLESVICSPYTKYEEYFKTRKEILSYYSHKGFLLGEPMVELIALGEAEIPINCDFSNLIEEGVGSIR
ncbi:MAG: hypothetical protein ACE5IJ_06125 [Thermoplasmata archaeon]